MIAFANVWAGEPANERAMDATTQPARNSVTDLTLDSAADTATEPSSQCLQLPDTTQSYGNITLGDFSQWIAIDDWKYLTNTQYLATGITNDELLFLEQQLEPTAEGSVHVVGRGEISPRPTYTLTQSIYLADGFDWGGSNEGGKLGFGLGGNSAPTGGQTLTDGFSVRLMWRGNGDGTARLVVYAYAADRRQNFPYGDDYPVEGFKIPIGEWFDVTMEVSANSSDFAEDGSVRIWVNNELMLAKSDIQWQLTGPEPAVDRLLYATFHGGSGKTWAPDGTVYARFSNVCWQPNV